MAKSLKCECDGCGKTERGEVGWWVVGEFADGGGIALVSLGDYEDQIEIWDFEFVGTPSILCGQRCVSKKLSDFMDAKRSPAIGAEFVGSVTDGGCADEVISRLGVNA